MTKTTPTPKHFVTDISKASINRIVESLAKSTAEWKDSASRLPSLTELSGEVVAKNETAASELGVLTEYQYTLNCLTH